MNNAVSRRLVKHVARNISRVEIHVVTRGSEDLAGIPGLVSTFKVCEVENHDVNR